MTGGLVSIFNLIGQDLSSGPIASGDQLSRKGSCTVAEGCGAVPAESFYGCLGKALLEIEGARAPRTTESGKSFVKFLENDVRGESQGAAAILAGGLAEGKGFPGIQSSGRRTPFLSALTESPLSKDQPAPLLLGFRREEGIRIPELLSKLGIKPEAVHEAARLTMDGEQTQLLSALTESPLSKGQAVYLLLDAGDKGRPSIAELSCTHGLESKGADVRMADKVAVLSGASDREGLSGTGSRDSVEAVNPSLSGMATSDKAPEPPSLVTQQILSPEERSAEKVWMQIVEKFGVSLRRNYGNIKVHLEPPALGRVEMNLSRQGEVLRATFFTETPMVKEILESHVGQLKQVAQNEGLQLEKFTVFVQDHFRHQRSREEFPEGGSPQRGGPRDTAKVGTDPQNPLPTACGAGRVDLFA